MREFACDDCGKACTVNEEQERLRKRVGVPEDLCWGCFGGGDEEPTLPGHPSFCDCAICARTVQRG